MKIKDLKFSGYERVLIGEDEPSGLTALIAIHSTTLGPACGGIRLMPYPTLREAEKDVLQLARGMSYKSALAGLGFGGGKSVIILDPSQKKPALFHAFGEFMAHLSGKYIAAKDMNITSEDLLEVKKRTPYVLGIEGAARSGGDPSSLTARGLVRAMEATAERLFGTTVLSGLKVAIQGVGYVGYSVARILKARNVEVFVSDSSQAAMDRCVQELGVSPIPLDNPFDFLCDVFSPCAIGGILNSHTIGRLKCAAVVGAANNQLATPADGMLLHERGILYAPDFVANAGGIINIFVEYEGYEIDKAVKRTDAIYESLQTIYQRASKSRKPPFVVANELAEDRLNLRSGKR